MSKLFSKGINIILYFFKSNARRVLYILGVILTITLSMVIVLCENSNSSFNLNMMVFLPTLLSILSALVLALFLNIIPNRLKKTKYMKISSYHIRYALLENAELFAKMYKACIKEQPANEIYEYSLLFNEDFYEAIKFLNLKAPSPNNELTWLEYITKKFERFSLQVYNILLRFSDYWDMQVIESLEKLHHSKLITTFVEKNNIWINVDGSLVKPISGYIEKPICLYIYGFCENRS